MGGSPGGHAYEAVPSGALVGEVEGNGCSLLPEERQIERCIRRCHEWQSEAFRPGLSASLPRLSSATSRHGDPEPVSHQPGSHRAQYNPHRLAPRQGRQVWQGHRDGERLKQRQRAVGIDFLSVQVDSENKAQWRFCDLAPSVATAVQTLKAGSSGPASAIIWFTLPPPISTGDILSRSAHLQRDWTRGIGWRTPTTTARRSSSSSSQRRRWESLAQPSFPPATSTNSGTRSTSAKPPTSSRSRSTRPNSRFRLSSFVRLRISLVLRIRMRISKEEVRDREFRNARTLILFLIDSPS